MQIWTQFSHEMYRMVQEAFSTQGTEPEIIAKFVLNNFKKRPNYNDQREKLQRFVIERCIENIIHFTKIENIPSILKYGIIPRAHLDNPVVSVVIKPVYSDESRFDNHSEMNCLSISFPNDRMFYSKRNKLNGGWAIVLLDPSVITEYYCIFYSTNAASKYCNFSSGIIAAQKMFSCLSIRKELSLKPSQTTDPQAEVLEDTIILPSKILKIAVHNVGDFEYLISKSVKNEMLEINPCLYENRHDMNYWHDKMKRFIPEDDYNEVLKYESLTSTKEV